jgi:fatty acid desaturase
MKDESFPIPSKLNLTISAVQIALLLVLLWCASWAQWWLLLPLSIGYGLVMNSAYAMLHEAEHGMLHHRRWLNDLIGAVLALFFPAPFHLIRQGHLGHHMRNRSDDEAFDFYFEGENPLWKRMQLYGILTGLFWLVILLGNLLAIVWPWYLQPRKFTVDRPTEALLQSLNRKFLPLVWLESVGVVALHATLIHFWGIPFWSWFAMLCGFGVMWSAMQYVHHFGANRDVMNGALNLRSWRWLDCMWLHHNWHLRHHQCPTVPWIYLPTLGEGETEPRGNVLTAYLGMWRGPSLTKEHVENKYADRIIR